MTATAPPANADPPGRADEALVSTVREVLAARLHAMADAVVDDLMADVLLALMARHDAP